MANPLEEILRLGYILGNIRPLSELDNDVPFTSLLKPNEVVTEGTRMHYKGEGVSDISVNRVCAAISAQTDFSLFQVIRPRSARKNEMGGQYAANADKLTCWTKDPVILPWETRDLVRFVRACDNELSALVNTVSECEVGDAEIYTGGGTSSKYVDGSLQMHNMLIADDVDTIYPWGILPTATVVKVVTGTIDSIELGGPPYLVNLTIEAGTLNDDFDEGLFYDEDKQCGCIITAIGDDQVTLLDNWNHDTAPGADDEFTLIANTHVVPGMIATLAGGDDDNNGIYLVTAITAAGALVLNTLDVESITSWDDMSNPLPTVLKTGDGVAKGTVSITSPYIWFPIFTLSQDLPTIPAGLLPPYSMFSVASSMAEATAQDFYQFPSLVDQLMEVVVKKLKGGTLTDYWSALAEDSIYNLDLRADAVTLDGAYRNAPKVDTYEGDLSDVPDDGRYVRIDGGPIVLSSVADGSALSLKDYPARTQLQLFTLNTLGRPVDKFTNSGPLGVSLTKVDTGVNPNLDADYDFVILDPDRTWRIAAKDLLTSSDFSIYEGMEIKGAVESVYVRGIKMFENGRLVGPKGHGRYLHRGL